MAFKRTILSAFLLTITCNTILANSNSDQVKSIDEVHIDLDIREGNLENILAAIEKKTEYSFFYTEKNLKDKSKIKLNRTSGTVAEVLLEVAEKKKLHFKQINNIISVKSLPINSNEKDLKIMVNVADIRVTGTITSESGETLPGVAVFVEGTTSGTISDIDGKYSIVIPEGSTLVFSYIGFSTQKILVGNQSVINVTMVQEARALEEVVIAALGLQKTTRSIGYAATNVTSDEVTINRTPNFMNALQGKIAGVNITSLGTGPAGTSKVRIRGQSSIGGQNNPLIVINGIPIDNTNFGTRPGNQGADNSFGQRGGGVTADGGDGLSSINPDDIESMTVLKGAAASALYGSRAKDGVIMINTKTKGDKKGIGVTYNLNHTIEQPLDFTDYQYEYGQGEFGIRPTSPNPTSGQWSFGERFAPGMTQTLFDGVVVPYVPVRGRINDFFRNGQNTTNTITLATNNDKGGMNFSFSDLNSKGIVPNNTYNRKTFNFGFTHEFSKKFNVRGNINYSIENNENPPNIADQDNSIPTALYNMANSMPLDVLRDNAFNAEGNEAVYSRFRNRTNPFFTLERQFNDIKRDRVFGNITAVYNITDWLFIQGRVGQDYWSRTQRVNNFPTGQASRAAAPAGFVNGVLTEEARNFREVNADFILSATKEFGDFGVNANVGGNMMKRQSELQSTQVTDFVIRDLYTPQNGRAKDPIFDRVERGVNSLFAFAEVSYKKYLFINGTIRNDWFSTLSPENRSILYPSVSAGWVFSENTGSSDWFNFGKLRLAYAEVGSDSDVAPYSNVLFYGINANLFNNQPVGQPIGSTLPNPNLRPMRVAETEVGFEMKMFQGKLMVDLAAYNKITTDQIVSAQISDASGFINTSINSGQSRNQGVEMLVTGVPVERGNFTWEVTVNGAYNKTKVLSLLTDTPGERITVGTHVFNGELRQVVGKEMGQVTGFGYLRDEQGRKVFGGNGLPLRTPQLVEFGSALPRWTGGITNSFNYKGVSFSFLIDFRIGGVMISGTNFNAVRHGLHKMTLEGREGGVVGEGVNQAGEPNTVVAPVQSYWEIVRSQALVEPIVYDGGFWKLRQVTAGYDFTKFLPEKWPISGLRLNLVANNVLILKKWVDNIDPESFGYASDNLVGMEATGLPTTRGMGFNLNVRF
ncbi:TonB-linked outer membrane protein, SusC/RagA family [Aquiflexum balticum DSM 16537]|uniref:TonB-linked outer membrane protein, SusC/RagA family n=1 Tax=Aquiflexum balticum DSM 16537 TaxID=758820 RepID=A0A1W2H9Z4_9BACT|nr:SusC/RagA family TonB-linked outer membrane protein [Aquiflexum balticum]SMD45611.1 TonB-linked outer membrane protein, SusC/RagA family [Aquiflexum balticum DSM 16537]